MGVEMEVEGLILHGVGGHDLNTPCHSLSLSPVVVHLKQKHQLFYWYNIKKYCQCM